MAGPIQPPRDPRDLSLTLIFRGWRGPRNLIWWRAVVGRRRTYYWISSVSFLLVLFLKILATYFVLRDDDLHTDDVQSFVARLFFFSSVWDLLSVGLPSYLFVFKYEAFTFAIEDVKLGLTASASCQASNMLFVLFRPATLSQVFDSDPTILMFFFEIVGLSIISSVSLCVASWITHLAAVKARGEWYLPVSPAPTVAKWTLATPAESSAISDWHLQSLLNHIFQSLKRLDYLYYVDFKPSTIGKIGKGPGVSRWRRLLSHRLTYLWISFTFSCLSCIPTTLFLSLQHPDNDLTYSLLRAGSMFNLSSCLLTFVRLLVHFSTRPSFSKAGVQYDMYGFISCFSVLFYGSWLPSMEKTSLNATDPIQKAFLLFVFFPSYISYAASVAASWITYIAAVEVHGDGYVHVSPRPTVGAWTFAYGREVEQI